MCKKLIYLVPFVLVLSVVSTASAGLVGRWEFDEGAGPTAQDSSGYAYDGTFVGDAAWASGVLGGALALDGSGDYVQTTLQDVLQTAENFTLSAWFMTNTTSTVQHIVWVGDGGGNGWGDAQELHLAINHFSFTNKVSFYFGSGTDTDGQNINIVSKDDFTDTSLWHHIVGVIENANGPTVTGRLYLDGQLVEPLVEGFGFPTTDSTDTAPLRDGWNTGLRIGAPGAAERYFNGLIDRVQIFEVAFTQEQVQNLMTGDVSFPLARGPSPADGALYPDTWVNLSWSPGDFAVSHDMYIGDNFDDVNDGAEGTFQGNQPEAFIVVGFPGFAYPDGLVPGTTYYWRIDEVNDTEPNSPWKGEVWSFSIPPRTAYNPEPANGAELVETDVELSWTAGFGAKLHTVYFGENFDDVHNAAGGLPQGITTYTPGPLKLAKTYYWRVDEFDVIDTHKGDVWSFTTEGAVGSPDPSNGAVDVKQTKILTWSPGVYAASHQVYFGTDKGAVRNADTGSPEYKGAGDLGSESYDPGKLLWDNTYYWRIDEANNTNPDSPWTGSLWSFTTANFLIVDDFEDYDAGENQIWFAWHDGLGFGTLGTEPYSPGNGTGSAVGDESTTSYTEETIVHGGNQSMPVFYDNSVLMYSEVEKTLSYPRDWTEKGVNTLTIWFRGDSANAAETLYVALNGNALVNHDNPNAAQITTWTQWNIDLLAFADQGVNLANVNTIAIGLGNKKNPVAGGSGTMYFDDIRLYPPPEPAP